MAVVATYDESGVLATGHFFNFSVPLLVPLADEFSGMTSLPPIIRLPECSSPIGQPCMESVYAEVLCDLTQYHDCPLDKNHVTGSKEENFRADIFSGPNVNSFIPDSFGSELVISSAFHARIVRSGLHGVRTDPLPIACNQSNGVTPVLHRLIGGDGRRSIRRPTIHVPEDNACMFCGQATVVCPACKHIAFYCPVCGEDMVVGDEYHQGATDRRHINLGLPDDGYIIDGRFWTGEDVFRSKAIWIITARFLRWLLTTDALPFVALPCRTNLDGCTPEQLAKLDTLRVG